MVIWVVEFSGEGYKIRKISGQKSISSKEIIVLCLLPVVASRQKLGIILEKKVLQKLKLSKSANSKKCAPKFRLFN